MSFGFSVGDFIAGAKLVWELYHKCFLVAKDAPSEFLELMRELSSLRGVLKCIEDEIITHRIDESRKLAIKRTMDGTTHTLRRLEALVHKYRKLGFSDGLQFWRRLRWVTEQRDIESFRFKIMVYTCTLNLCVSSVGESTISTIERDFKQALQQRDLLLLSDLPAYSPGSAPMPNSQGTSRRESAASCLTNETSPSQRENYESPITSPTSDGPPRPPSIRPISPLGSVNSVTSNLINFNTDEDDDISAASVLDVLARASDLLSNCPERDSILLPPVTLDWDPPNPKNLVSDAMHKRFLANAARRGADARRISTEDLLRTGTWWVLKSRNAVRLQNNSIPNASSASSSDPNSGLYQAYFDLMKASWVLYNYLLSDPDNTVNMLDEDVKSFSTLQDAIDGDFVSFRQTDLSVGDIEDMELNDKIWETKQPREVAFDEPNNNPLPVLDPGRWLTIEENHAGGDGEESHLRIFVNAELGNKRVRMRTRDARYMVVLWTKEGQSELKITLCNQSGTLKISRDITPEDIRPFLEVDEASNVPPAVDIEFPEMETTIHFLHISDFRKFITIPTTFFDAVQERNPTSGNETIIYRCVLQRLELLHPNTNKPINSDKASHSVDLRICETTGEEGWMTTRRLVLSSSARAPQPWCRSYFLPLSNVQIKGDGARLTVRWSDCGQKFSGTTGSFVEVISYVYDAERPNRCLGLGFGSIDDASSFEEVVLKFTLTGKYQWDSTKESRYIYSIRSTITNAERFKGLLIRHRSPEWRYSEAFYLPRDLDFELKNNGLRLRFLKAYYTNYISDYVERLCDLEQGKQPKFSHCEKKPDSVNLHFVSREDAQNLLRHITDRWELKFVRQIARVSHKPTSQKSFFRAAGSSSYSPADLSLWQKGLLWRLVIRRPSTLSSSPVELYLTAALNMDSEHGSEKMMVQKDAEITRGALVDIATLEAVGGRRGSGAARDGGGGWVKAGQTLTIEFGTFKDKEAFAEALEPSLL